MVSYQKQVPLCEFHHKIKHSHGWRLEQPVPGTLLWVTPSGRKYHITPDPHPT